MSIAAILAHRVFRSVAVDDRDPSPSPSGATHHGSEHDRHAGCERQEEGQRHGQETQGATAPEEKLPDAEVESHRRAEEQPCMAEDLQEQILAEEAPRWLSREKEVGEHDADDERQSHPAARVGDDLPLEKNATPTGFTGISFHAVAFRALGAVIQAPFPGSQFVGVNSRESAEPHPAVTRAGQGGQDVIWSAVGSQPGFGKGRGSGGPL